MSRAPGGLQILAVLLLLELSCTLEIYDQRGVLQPCGNAVINPGEVCDDGNLASGDGCSGDCRSLEICGNGIVDLAAAEVCDDGNTEAGDGCSPTCRHEVCGDAIRDPGEVCDDGNLASGDGCSTDCLSLERCGNGVVDLAAGEVCDDGNVASGDGCSADCQSDELCGNGLVDVAAGEECDAAGPSSLCDADCTLPRCGDGLLNVLAGEQCDDGNANGGDGCEVNCTLTP